MEYELNPAKIVGECSYCGHLYDICRNGFVCDVCGNTKPPRGARFVDAWGLTKKDNRDIAVLNAMYKLEDPRRKP